MNINEIISSIQQIIPQFITSCCIINGSIFNLNEIDRLGYIEYRLRTQTNMPAKLYKYFPNLTKNDQNYSIYALKNNTVFMQTPSEFDDIYDSDINLDFQKYEKLRLIEYCNRCSITVNNNFSTQEIGNILLEYINTTLISTKNFNSIFIKKPNSLLEEKSYECFSLKLRLELQKHHDLAKALSNIIRSDFKEYSSRLKNIFRTTCFTTTPYSQLMWGGSYADCHRGFCVEYTILPNNKNYQYIYQNLFPMIYCKIRPDMTEKLIKLQDAKITEDALWNIYFHGVLRKSIDWLFQNEWRLLLPMEHKDIHDYNIKFFPITKVFIGNRMTPKKRKEIIDICNARNIPYTGIIRNPNIFEMQDCNIKCEQCFNYIKNI